MLTALLNTTAGAFAADSSVQFVISDVTTPTEAQAALAGFSSAILSSSGIIVSSSRVGSMSSFYGNFFGQSPPFFLSNLQSELGVLRVSLIPTFSVPSGGCVIVSIFVQV